jgi:streptomycin 6-kinase
MDPGARGRLVARFGTGVEPWFDRLPASLSDLERTWAISLREPIPRGTVSVVFRCRTSDGGAAVLKISPDHPRIGLEARALAEWQGIPTPRVIRFDPAAGALLIQEIQPGTPLAESTRYPDVATMAVLLTALHIHGRMERSFPEVARRVEYLFTASSKLYDRTPGLLDTVPADLYERGHRLAADLARAAGARVLLHGDLTPVNVLDGGPQGAVAIDPAPCLGDPAFDAVDLLMWRANDVETIERRAANLAAATDGDADRMLAWCSAFAAMTAMERASDPASPRDGIAAALSLASRTPV